MVYGLSWGNVPEGFKRIGRDPRMMIVREDMETCIDFTNFAEPPSVDEGLYGRGALAVHPLEDGGALLVRRYRHGGALRALTRDYFFTWPPRPFRELRLTEEAHRRGVPTVEPLAALVQRLIGPFYRGWLVTRQLKGARDLWAIAQAGGLLAADKASCLEAAARAVRAMHRCGLDHRDLNLKNILLRREAGRWTGYVIDLDQSRLLHGAVPADSAEKNLARLERSVRKLDPGRRFLSAADWEHFLRSYREAG
jgi:tRNA A-37 threonylcarbamoyl transferase component Bud32